MPDIAFDALTAATGSQPFPPPITIDRTIDNGHDCPITANMSVFIKGPKGRKTRIVFTFRGDGAKGESLLAGRSAKSVAKVRVRRKRERGKRLVEKNREQK